jgi:hypothetical protein
MKTFTATALAVLCLAGFGTLTMAGEMGKDKGQMGEMKGEKEKKHDDMESMKSDKGKMKDEGKMKSETGKGDMGKMQGGK